MSTSRILQLAQIITANATEIDEHISLNGLTPPSFGVDGPFEGIQKPTPSIEKAKQETISAMVELQQLLEGGMAQLMPQVRRLGLLVTSTTTINCHYPTPIRYPQQKYLY